MAMVGDAPSVASVDALFGVHNIMKSTITKECPPAPVSKPRSLKQLKRICHLGVPSQFRCSVWIVSVVRVVNPHFPDAEVEAYGTTAMTSSIESTWSHTLKATFANGIDREEANAPNFGLQQSMLDQLIQYDYREWNPCWTAGANSIPPDGVKSLTGVLCAVHQVLGIEYCPSLPDITAILLTHMPESYVFATIREAINDSSHFLPLSQKAYYSWCKTYSYSVERLFPATHKVMDKCGAFDPRSGLDPIFKRFFITLLRREDVLRFMDIFMIEGCKAIFRLALSLLHIVPKKDLNTLHLTDSESWWKQIRIRTMDPGFSFRKHLDIMYPSQLRKIAVRYPRRHVLGRLMKHHEKWALQNMPSLLDQSPRKPIGYTSEKGTLAKPVSFRQCLTEWLPAALKSTKLDLIYSTDIHGRSLASFYNRCEKSKNTVVLVEAFTLNGKRRSLIGMFATQAWSINPRPYGDSDCFLFRADHDAMCFKWTPDPGNIENLENNAVSEQFMVSRSDFIAMGANNDATNGIRLDKDLVKGESHPALGFNNEPLPGDNQRTFEVGHLEVYRLIRDVE